VRPSRRGICSALWGHRSIRTIDHEMKSQHNQCLGKNSHPFPRTWRFFTPISSHLGQSDTHFLALTHPKARTYTPISSYLNVFDTHFLALAHRSKARKEMKTGGLHNIFTQKMVLTVWIGCSVAHDSFDTHFLALRPARHPFPRRYPQFRTHFLVPGAC